MYFNLPSEGAAKPTVSFEHCNSFCQRIAYDSLQRSLILSRALPMRTATLAIVICGVTLGAAADTAGSSSNSNSNSSSSSSSRSSNSSCAPSAIEQARRLSVPAPSAMRNGEFEGAAFWAAHDSLLRRAWLEYEPAHPALFTFDSAFEAAYVHPAMREAVAALRREAAAGSSSSISGSSSSSSSSTTSSSSSSSSSSSAGGIAGPGVGVGRLAALEQQLLREDLFEELAPGVWGTRRLFTAQFGADMLAELRRQAGAGIPLRRPNGMNRYGTILGDVGFGAVLAGLAAKYVRPLAEALFPAAVGAGDAAEQYAFAIRYKVGEDVALAEHRDASVATLNLCLGTDAFEGGGLEFVQPQPETQPQKRQRPRQPGAPPQDAPPAHPRRTTTAHLAWEPGLAILHLGQLRHAALPLTSGERANMVVWLHAAHGVVRVAPYEPSEQLSARERWGRGAQQHDGGVMPE